MKIWREIRVSETTQQKLADQTRVIITNGWMFEVKLDEIQRKINEEEDMGEPRIELQKHVWPAKITGWRCWTGKHWKFVSQTARSETHKWWDLTGRISRANKNRQSSTNLPFKCQPHKMATHFTLKQFVGSCRQIV